MDNKLWHTEGSIQYQQLTAEHLEETLDLVQTAFFPYENVCRSIGVANDHEALLELRELTREAAKDGISVIAIDTSTRKIVGAAINKIQVEENPAFENIASSWKCVRSRYIAQFMTEFDNLCNLFDHCKIDCLFELMFLTTSPEYRGKSIGKKLTEISIEIGRNLAKGVNVKKSIDGTELSLEPTPKIISSILTSTVTQIIGKKLGFQIVAEKGYEEFEFQGKSLASLLGDESSTLTLQYQRL